MSTKVPLDEFDNEIPEIERAEGTLLIFRIFND
jgi:hypothetical protein